MSDIKPVIDDQFWFDRSGEMVKGAGERLDKWADRARDMIIWVYGLYTAASVLAVEFKHIDEAWNILVLAVPYLFIILVYWKSQSAQIPIDVTFHPSSPTDIKKAYVEAYKEKATRVQTLVRYSFIAMFAVAIALITALIVKNDQRKEPPKAPDQSYFNGLIEKKKEVVSLVMTGRFPPDSLLSISCNRNYYDDKTKNSYSLDTTYSVLNSDDGTFQHTLNVDTLALRIVYAISYNENQYRKTLQKEFVIKKIGKS